ncbi:MAG: ABC transporter permease [Vicinamibacterales bacterium]
MIGDIFTVAWKEWRELLQLGGSVRGGRLSLVILVAVFGVFLPLQSGAEWVESPATVFYWGWVPLMLVSSAVADSFAGERERHTLETLLASRLPDAAILLGKMAAAVAYGWGLVLVMLVLSLVTVNVAARTGPWLLFPWRFAIGAPLLALLGAGLAATAGVLVSLRAATVRQAAQTLNVGVLLLIFIPVLGLQALPEAWQAQAGAWALSVGADGLLWASAGLLALLDTVLLTAAFARFRRSRLVLD